MERLFQVLKLTAAIGVFIWACMIFGPRYWANDACSDCEVTLKAAWILVAIAACPALVVLYYVTDTRYSTSASLAECGRLAFDMMLNFAQNLGILGMVFVPWPHGLVKAFEFSQVFVLSLKSFGSSCASLGDFEQYMVTAACFYGVLVLLLVLGGFSHLLPFLKRRKLSWSGYRIACTVGKIYQGLFVTMANLGLSPFMCYNHPNGQQSLLKYPNLLCQSSSHRIMEFAGAFVLLLCLSHFVLCLWAICLAPTWSLKSPKRLTSIAFLMANFRPSTWWFGLVILLRGPLLSLAQVVAPDDEGLQLLVTWVCLSFSWYLMLI